VQNPVRKLIGLGRLPKSEDANPEFLEKFQEQLSSIEKPISDSEALELAKLLGPDDCYGLAWTIVHIIEDAPGWPIASAIVEVDVGWRRILTDRAKGL
jgi:hypothetical protein